MSNRRLETEQSTRFNSDASQPTPSNKAPLVRKHSANTQRRRRGRHRLRGDSMNHRVERKKDNLDRKRYKLGTKLPLVQLSWVSGDLEREG